MVKRARLEIIKDRDVEVKVPIVRVVEKIQNYNQLSEEMRLLVFCEWWKRWC